MKRFTIKHKFTSDELPALIEQRPNSKGYSVLSLSVQNQINGGKILILLEIHCNLKFKLSRATTFFVSPPRGNNLIEYKGKSLVKKVIPKGDHPPDVICQGQELSLIQGKQLQVSGAVTFGWTEHETNRSVLTKRKKKDFWANSRRVPLPSRFFSA